VTREELLEACFGKPDWPRGDVVLYWRTVGAGADEVEVAAIGQVATDPAYRGLRLASALVATAHRIAAERGLEWAALFGVSSLYGRLGYVTPPDPPKPDFLVCPLVAGAEWPPGEIDTRGEW
jgi:GNAT superfamily N-acetyltransferase